ncbi:MAG TPA: helix-turn-helix domain-containing protein [Acidimicrobiales bacterium]|nr:helix-turn-helix domain-containing protein [Acidimicrobiales bacterium]
MDDSDGTVDAAQPRLAVLKALGDNTRYAIYLELARARSPRSTAEVADLLGLHPNTVRPHLEQMRAVGLLAVEADARGSVGRPLHRYALAPDAPSLGLEAPAFPLLAAMLTRLAARAAIAPDDAAAAGAEQGRALAAATQGLAAATPAAGAPEGRRCVAALSSTLADLGFDPATGDGGTAVTIAFTHCPFRELAEAHPEVVCHLHRGLIEGFVEQLGGASVDRFATLADRDPCQVELSVR